MARTPDRRPGLSVDEDDLLSREPTEPDTDYFVTRTGNIITKEEWRRSLDSSLLKSIDYTRASGVITQEDIKIFNDDGVTLRAHLRIAYTRAGGVVTSTTRTRIA